jgi:spore coat polysaccharide biosynthesis protein SpsF (cytidylyltransferase family)
MTLTSVVRRVAIIQARMSSSRLPGKVLAPLLGLPLIVFMARRVQRAQLVDEVVVATSTDASDDRLAATLADHGITCVRGSLDDVLDRFRTAARVRGASQIVRLTGDCPLMDADLVDRALTLLSTSGADYVSNVSPPTYPDGLDVEAFTMTALEDAWANAKQPSEREHVTLYLRAGHEHVRTAGWSALSDLSALRWTVDHADDLAHVRALLELAGATSETGFDRFDLYRVIERERLGAGADHQRNEGLAKSLANDPGAAGH